MASTGNSKRILIIGNKASAARAGIPPDAGFDVELAGSLAEACEKQASGDYARVIIDPAAFGYKQFELVEDEMYRREQEFKALVDNSPDSISRFGRDLRCIYANTAAKHLVGLPTDAPIGVTIRNVGVPDDVAKPWEKAVGKVFTTGKEQRLEILYPLHSKERWYDIRIVPEFASDGTVQSVISVARDITERKLAEESLKKYQILSQHSNDIVLFVRRDGQIIEANNAAAKAYGYTRDELLSLTIFDLRTTEPALKVEDQMATADDEGILFETKHRRKDGSVFDVEVSSRGTDIGDQRILLSVIRDITERKRAEEEQKDLLQREQHIARMLQQALVPPSVPEEINGYRFAVKYKPALREAEIGGDFFDVFNLGDGRVCVMIGDVTGKGLRAAMRVASARFAIRGCAFIEAKPSRILALANESLCCSTEPENDMLTAFLAIIDTRARSVVFSNAGHESPVVLHSDGQTEELIGRGLPLGIMPGISYTEGTCRLSPGSRMLMITDGITEARTPSVELFGKQRVIDYVKDNSKSPLQDVVDGLLQAATAHAGGELQDDAAIVLIEQYDGKGV